MEGDALSQSLVRGSLMVENFKNFTTNSTTATRTTT